LSEIFGRLGGPREAEEQADESDLVLSPSGARWLRRHFAAGVVGLTTSVSGVYRAATLTACLIVSIDPLQCLVSIENDSQMEGWLRESGAYAMNILPWEEQFIADRFAGMAPLASVSFAGIAHFVGATGSPILKQAIAWMDCRIVSTIETGDHTLFLGEAIGVGTGEGNESNPMLYFDNRYRRVAP
jgi:3-hydroxy-9,10-secoandrosta-1,3,5(10)-triene-9,17-dione monooxygenase reductase component